MSQCSINKFTITRGSDNTFVFTIKQDGTTLPMEISVGDTFEARLVKLDTEVTVLTKTLAVVDALSGKVELVLTEAEVATLESDRGPKVDRYYLLPTYKIVIDCSTLNNGDFIAKVNEVYVD